MIKVSQTFRVKNTLFNEKLIKEVIYYDNILHYSTYIGNSRSDFRNLWSRFRNYIRRRNHRYCIAGDDYQKNLL